MTITFTEFLRQVEEKRKERTCKIRVIPPPEDLDEMHQFAWYTNSLFIGQVFDAERVEKNNTIYYTLLNTSHNREIFKYRRAGLSNRAKLKLDTSGVNSLHIIGICCSLAIGTKNEDFKHLLQGGVYQ